MAGRGQRADERLRTPRHRDARTRQRNPPRKCAAGQTPARCRCLPRNEHCPSRAAPPAARPGPHAAEQPDAGMLLSCGRAAAAADVQGAHGPGEPAGSGCHVWRARRCRNLRRLAGGGCEMCYWANTTSPLCAHGNARPCRRRLDGRLADASARRPSCPSRAAKCALHLIGARWRERRAAGILFRRELTHSANRPPRPSNLNAGPGLISAGENAGRFKPLGEW